MLARVDGVSIFEGDVLFRLASESHQRDVRPEFKRRIVDAIVDEELIAKQAIAIGLDRDPVFMESVREAEVRLRAVRRKALTELYWKREIAAKVSVGDGEVNAYFEKNAERLKTEIHVHQILRRSKAEIEALHARLMSGASFDDVAATLFLPVMDGANKPWDLGFLSFKQVPAAWGDVVYKLALGEISPILAGPGERYWIVRLIDRRENKNLTVEAVKPMIVDMLKEEQIQDAKARALSELRKNATVQIFTDVLSDDAP